MTAALLARVIDEAEARQLPVLIHEWWGAPDARSWLARSLRIDLALLTERPDLVVPCLHRRCAWLGGPAEAGFYRERPEVPRTAAALRELVSGWRPGRPWLRALRPPQVPLDGGVLEEYRTSLDGEVRFSDDGATIAVVGADAGADADAGAAIAWDRATGRRVVGARARVPAPPAAPLRWRLAADPGRSLVLERDDHQPHPRHPHPHHPHHQVAHRLELACELPDDFWQSVHPLTDDLVLASGFDTHALVDIRRARIAWIAEGSVEDAVLSPDGERLFRVCRDTVEIATPATGDALARWPVPGVRSLALSTDGTLATRSLALLRLWAPDAAPRVGAASISPHGWTAAKFSADGDLLLTGGLLCDGRTGAALHVLDLGDPRGYLVGGPPLGGQRPIPGGLADISPFGLRIWDARDGSIVTHRELSANLSDVAALAPTGAHCALCALEDRSGHAAGHLRVHALPSGELVFQRTGVHLAQQGRLPPSLYVPGFTLEPYAGFALGFSPDGAHLWWETADGERWLLPLAAPDRVRRLAADEPTPREPEPAAFAVQDGLLDVGVAQIPCDDEHAVAAPDGRSFAYRTSHYALEDA